MKKNKKVNEKAKANALLLFKSLISNDTAIVGARRKGWWWALIMMLVSGLVAAIPATVQAGKKKGEDFINTTNVSGYDVSFRKMLESFKADGIELTIHQDGDKENAFIEATKDGASLTEETLYKHFNQDGKLDFEAFYTVNDIDSAYIQGKLNNVATYATDGSIDYTARNSSMVIFSKHNVVSYLYMTGSTSATSSFYGDYQSFEDGYKITSILGDFETVTEANYATYVDGVWNNVKSFYTTSYKTTVFKTTWQTGLIILGINYAVILFMGLMIFVLTRGKQNPFRIYSFWETQKISYWSSVAPGLLAVALGFLLSNFAQVVFAMLLGIRIMWMAMKSLRPENASPELLEDKKADKVKTVKVK